MVGLLSLVLMLVAALAVDIGMQRVARTDMQSLADVVALDLSRDLTGQNRSTYSQSDLQAAADASRDRNTTTLGDGQSVTPELGIISSTGVYTTAAADQKPNAVKVTATTSVNFSFSSLTGGATRTAIGSTIKTACYTLGSFAARFRSGDSALIATLVEPMNELLRPQANLDAASYTGLANATASLDEIAAALNLGTTDDLLTGTVTARRLIEASIRVLNGQTPRNALAISALEQLVMGRASLDTPVLLTKVLSISPSDTAALQAKLHVLDLVAGTILVADGVNGFKLGNGNLGAKVAGVASLTTAELSVIERPRQACGPFGSAAANAQTSQVRGSAMAKFELPTINLGGGDIVQTSPSTVLLDVNLGNATGRLLAEPVCRSGTPNDPDLMQVGVRSGLSTLRLSTELFFRTTLDVDVGMVDVTWSQLASAGVPMPDTETVADLEVPPNDNQPVSTGGGSLALGDVVVAANATNIVATLKKDGTSVSLDRIEPQLAPIAQQLAVHAAVNGRLDTLATNIDSYLTPLLTLMGLRVSGADVLAVGRPVCGAPVLRG